MSRKSLLSLLLALSYFSCSSTTAGADTSTSYAGRGWTLTLTYKSAAHGSKMSGTFRSRRQSFRVMWDWIPAADQGSDLLRFYGHPFGPKSPVGLVGVATLGNTCNPTCVASKQYRLQEVPNLATLPNTLPGVGQPSILLRLSS
jgi:hypothetical protein